MAIDRHASGLVILRVAMGTFFLFEGINKLAWLTSSAVLAARFQGWLADAAAGSWSRWYLEQVAIPGTELFARLVPLGELATGIALLAGVWTAGAALAACLMVLNIHLASGALFKYQFLTNGYGLPVVGGLLALAMGGVRLPLSVRR